MAFDYAERARTFVGTPFRPQGRGAEGLDCVGLVLATYAIPEDAVRRDYHLRGDHRREILRRIGQYFRAVSQTQARAGDVMLLQVADEQLHLAVKSGAGFIHAHAKIGRVVETPGEPVWRVIGTYRKRTRKRSS